jgi:hypothetical protein
MRYRERWEIERIRELALERAETSSLQIVADAIGMNKSTLQNFVKGSIPHPRIRRLLQTWYGQQQEEAESEGEAAVQAIVQDLPPADWARGALELRGLIIDLYRRFRVTPPAWTIAPHRAEIPPAGPGSTT